MELVRGYQPGLYSKSFTRPIHAGLVRNMRQFPRFGRTCAVVGTSSTLMQRHYGNDIDLHDTVVRVNSVPLLQKYWRYTGVRDDVRIATYPLVPPANRNVRVVYYCHIPWYPSSCWESTRVDHHPRLSPTFVRQVQRTHALRVWPTTGLIAFEVASRLCQHVTAYGFGIDRSFSNCSHYYNVGRDNTCVTAFGKKLGNSNQNWEKYRGSWWHNFSYEAAFFAKMNPSSRGRSVRR